MLQLTLVTTEVLLLVEPVKLVQVSDACVLRLHGVRLENLGCSRWMLLRRCLNCD